MRTYRLLGALAGVVVLVALLLRHNPSPPTPFDPAPGGAARQSEAALPTEPAAEAPVPSEPPAKAPAEAPQPVPSAADAANPPASVPSVTADAAAPVAVAEAVAPPRLPQLPEATIAARPARVVPEDEPPPPPRPIEIRRAPALAGVEGRGAASATADAPARAALQLASRAPAPRDAARPIQIAGVAEPSGATALRVAGKPLRLFGVRPPASGDRCAPSALGANPLPCADQANKLLAAHLTRNAGVSCRVPAPSSAADAAICLDADGVDLGGLLVAEGLAVADPSQSYDYVGAESVARSNRRGLWLFR
jgi:endonuclease YncB( thermonuclease family)